MKLLKQLNELTAKRYCLICDHQIKNQGFGSIFCEPDICIDCQKQLKPIYKWFNVSGRKCLALNRYEDPLKSWLIRYKEQFDIALAPIFLGLFLPVIKLIFPGHFFIPAPSSVSDIHRRGFAHMTEICRCSDLKAKDILRKNTDRSQKGKSSDERRKIMADITAVNLSCITRKKVVVLDDVLTTGATLLSSFKALEKGNPTSMKGLVIMKV